MPAPHVTTPGHTALHLPTPQNTCPPSPILHHTCPHQPSHPTPHHICPHQTFPHHTMPHSAMPCHAMPHRATPHLTTSHHHLNHDLDYLFTRDDFLGDVVKCSELQYGQIFFLVCKSECRGICRNILAKFLFAPFSSITLKFWDQIFLFTTIFPTLQSRN